MLRYRASSIANPLGDDVGRQPVNYYAGIDVSLVLSSVCIVDATGELVKEAKVESHPDALVKFFKAFGLPLTVIGLEAVHCRNLSMRA
jgi:hypothetical protein